MRTLKLRTYRSFVNAGRPYNPVIDDHGRLLLPNFATSPDNAALHHARRLVISSGIIYNVPDLTVGWVCSTSRVGFRWRWFYVRDMRLLTWHDLSWDDKRRVVKAYFKYRDDIPFFYAPTKRYAQWSKVI